MRLSLFTDFALRVLMFGALKDGTVFSLSEVSEAYGVSRNHLVKVVNFLAKLGYLETKCFDPKTNRCPVNGMCRLKGVLGEAVQAYYATLDRYTLHDLVSGPARKRMANLLLHSPVA